VSLADRLKRDIAAGGPLTVADFMRRCLHDPQEGYYTTRPALGVEGDFITAPLVSQMFGELLGLWVAETWLRLGGPKGVRFVEMGPGDGTLMDDALRAARLAKGFLDEAEVVLVETSEPLAARQRARLEGKAPRLRWISRLSDLGPGGPVLLVANELLDCLPARQFVRTPRGWAERRLGLDANGELAFGHAPCLPPPGAPETLIPGQVWEVSPAQIALGAELGALVARDGGAALLIDYGRDRPEPGDTLQALKAHRKVDPLEQPGEADLTVWADFPSVLQAARTAGAAVTPILPQGLFLARLGVVERAEALARSRPDLAPVVGRQLARLTDPDQMGSAFKACAIAAPNGPALPGFEETP
jgi:NADH dehydrogenase [ubiquinone] 1 alpha subcomplex assembly factor 7